MANFNTIVNKLKGIAQKNPDKVRDALEKVEGAVNSRTGGKYSDKLNRASDAAKGGLGIPDQGRAPGPGPGQPGQVPGQPGQVPDQPGQFPGQPGQPPRQ
ncbi:MAG: antitoxin [Propionibacteriales bacterium]|nr:antitoxin [Propionibacteriales bacterium]